MLFRSNHTNRYFNKSGVNDLVIGNIGILDFNGKFIAFAVAHETPEGGASMFDSVTEESLYNDKSNNIEVRLDPISKILQSLINQLTQ